ncbi:hypothetical protein [Streptomyces sp. NPDC058701]|uniref:hypothetical protein n=1 Tax=Streptomyces sp. NPDC058701 TaxID=3346608 RepID=UPI00364C1A22
MSGLGVLLGDEARRKGVHVLLAPALNLHRSPHAGRPSRAVPRTRCSSAVPGER